ncbi:MAG TPA: 3,4-dihydroxyphenylacetate 2,3-dioxygenase [Trueperaceae bacterium]
MPLVPARQPPFDIVRSSFLELGVSDLDRSRDFYVERLGFVESDGEGDALYLRGLEETSHHSLVLRRTREPLALRLGFRVASEADLEKAQGYFSELGCDVERLERPHRGPSLSVRDPLGVPLEFHAGIERVARKLQRYGEHRGAKPARIDHFNLFVADVQEAYEQYARLGFRTTEYTETEDADPALWAVWMHRKGNVHDLALTSGRGPRLHHVGIWVPSVLDVINTCDVLATTGHLDALERGPGRHGISNAFFLYLRDPDGHRVELYTCDYLTVDPDFEPIGWKLSDPQRQTLWGAPAPRSWFEEGSHFEGTEVKEPRLPAKPIVAV